MPRHGPLASLRVLDLSRLLPGPFASLVLADLGADVVKIEDPNGGDYMRWTPPIDGDFSVLFAGLNRGKRSVALDMKNPEDRALFLELVKAADVVLESFRPGVMARLGVGWEQLSAVNPRIVLCSISGYGQQGPWKERAGHDIDYLALAGVLGMIGVAGGAPALPNVQFADIAGGGLLPLVGILAALFERQQTGKGRWVDASMTEGVMSTGFMTLIPQLAGVKPSPDRGRGTLSGELPCYSIYETGDGRHLAVGALEPKFWAAFCASLGHPELASAGLDAGEDGENARRLVSGILKQKSLADWTTFFASHDVCVEPILSAEEIVAHPVHQGRGSFFQGPHGLAQRTPVRFADREDAPAQGQAPALGADRTSVVAEWLHPEPRRS
jgi:crotonobetainyl-CoA:carnitine CoA-transferase CaiB-like acyl-CoA transferase